MNEENLQDLQKLAIFLKTMVPDKAFSYSSFTSLGTKNPLDAIVSGGGCGTVACAIGWTPAVFPDRVAWTTRITENNVGVSRFEDNPNVPGANRFLGDVCLIDKPTITDLEVGMRLFNLTEDEARYLFIPASTSSDYITSPLSGRATKQQVAEHIESFIARKRADPTWDPVWDLE